MTERRAIIRIHVAGFRSLEPAMIRKAPCGTSVGMNRSKLAISLAALGAGCAGDFGVIDRPLSSVCHDVTPRGEQPWPGPFEVEVLWHWRGEGLPADLSDQVGSAVANIQERLTVAGSPDEPIIVGALRGRRGLVALQARDGSLVNRVDTPMSKCAPAGDRVACMNGMDLVLLDPVRDQEIIAGRSEERYYIDSLVPGSSYAVGESLYIEGRYAEVAQMLGFPVTVFGAAPYDAIVRSFDGTYYVSDLLESESVNIEVSRTVNIPYTFSDYVGAVEFTDTSISIVDRHSRVDIDTDYLISHD